MRSWLVSLFLSANYRGTGLAGGVRFISLAGVNRGESGGGSTAVFIRLVLDGRLIAGEVWRLVADRALTAILGGGAGSDVEVRVG